MTVDIRACHEGKSLEFSGELSMRELEFSSGRPFAEPIAVSGSVRTRAGILELNLTASTRLHLVCDRCAEPFLRELRRKFSVTLVESLNSPEDDREDDIALLRDGVCDIDEIVIPALILEIDMKNLCSEDCKGLCPDCGANLNGGPCACPKRKIDPRLEKLGAFFDR